MISERTARRVAPLLYLVVALFFLLPFASASSNTATAKNAAHQLLGAGISPSLVASLTACLDALNGKTLVTYSRLALAPAPIPPAAPSTWTPVPRAPPRSR